MSTKIFTAKIFRWLHQVNRDGNLCATDPRVGLELSEYFNEDDEGGRAWPGCKTIGDPIGLHESTVLRSVRRLAANGHLRVKWGQQGSGHSNQYWMIEKDPDQGELFRDGKPAPAQVSADKKPAPAQVSKPARVQKKPARVHGKPAPAQEIHPRTTLVNHPRGESDSPAVRFAGKKKEAAEEEKTSANSELSARRPRKNQGARATDEGAAFARFWRVYPRHIAEERARKAFARAIEDTDPETVIAAARHYALERQGEPERYTAHAANWLRDRRWRDPPPNAPIIDESGNVVAFERSERRREQTWEDVTAELLAEIGERRHV